MCDLPSQVDFWRKKSLLCSFARKRNFQELFAVLIICVCVFSVDKLATFDTWIELRINFNFTNAPIIRTFIQTFSNKERKSASQRFNKAAASKQQSANANQILLSLNFLVFF